jgi:hypothetical protein
MLRVKGLVPPELSNRFGSKIIPKLRSAESSRRGSISRLKLKARLRHRWSWRFSRFYLTWT